MGEYEPRDSRDVTQSSHTAPGEPPRTGPREDAARRQARQDEAGAGSRLGQVEQDLNTAAVERGQPLGEADLSAEETPDVIRLRDDSARRPDKG